MATSTEEKLISQIRIADMLGITRRTLRRLIIKGEFPKPDVALSKTLLRWQRRTVDRWIENQAHESFRRR